MVVLLSALIRCGYYHLNRIGIDGELGKRLVGKRQGISYFSLLAQMSDRAVHVQLPSFRFPLAYMSDTISALVPIIVQANRIRRKRRKNETREREELGLKYHVSRWEPVLPLYLTQCPHRAPERFPFPPFSLDTFSSFFMTSRSESEGCSENNKKKEEREKMEKSRKSRKINL